MGATALVEKVKKFWHEQIPGWLPVCITLIGGAVSGIFYSGRILQKIEDNQEMQEKQILDIQQYLRTHPIRAVAPDPNHLQSDW